MATPKRLTRKEVAHVAGLARLELTEDELDLYTEQLATVLERAGSRTWRPRLTESLTAYERLRHRARLGLIALGVEQGMTVTDVQRHWAITKQLANRALRQIGSPGAPGSTRA